MDKTDIPGTFNAGAMLAPINETNMARIWNKHKQTNTTLKRKVFIGMSGGVDSSVAAFLLKKDGYDVTGVFINGYNADGCEEKDAEDARKVAEHIGIPFYVLNAREEYFENVVQYMIDEYKRGITPNPDVMCNKKIKFGIFLDKALKLGADYIATGHYTCLHMNDEFRISNFEKHINSPTYRQNPKNDSKSNPTVGLPAQAGGQNPKFCLYEAKDRGKDQSYFLWTLTQEQLKHCLFPIGGYTKPEVREIARKTGLPTANKKDSQGICFLGKVKLPEFLKEYIEPRKGDVFDTEGNKVGEHDGVQFYTIGQRHINLQLTTRDRQQTANNIKQKTDRKPFYIAEKDVKRNALVIAEGSSNPALFRSEIEITDVNFIDPLSFEISVRARVRYRQPLAKAVLSKSKNRGRYRIVFDEPQKFIAPGQSAVFYSAHEDKNGLREMLGGGVIT